MRETTTLADLLDAPERALNLSPAHAAAALARIEGLAAVLRARLATAAPAQNGAHADEMLTADEVARRTGMSKRWLYAKAKAGHLPFARRMGTAVRFSARGIEPWLAARKVGTGAVR